RPPERPDDVRVRERHGRPPRRAGAPAAGGTSARSGPVIHEREHQPVLRAPPGLAVRGGPRLPQEHGAPVALTPPRTLNPRLMPADRRSRRLPTDVALERGPGTQARG